ncbi:MAG: mannose-phosphate guanylyltransferase / phosphomannomutase [Actinomycetota bacterium]|jgi:mannose-1-phosphate guanylyltransferase/phosphomannomutase|nr:mannose-phosphate guanylyltransferase / phosphomannomutase [Actinomycetota bacterium]
MKAVIMAGGEGTRLRPLTSNHPKPMIPLADRPMMEHIVQLLQRHGFEEIVVTVAFLANHIRNYFGDGSEFGVRMVYATEESPLGTAGSVRNAMDELDERFLVISGDVLTDIDLSAIVTFHEKRGALATIGLTAVENPLEFGIVITNDDGTVQRFLEKPGWGQVFSDTVNNGIFVLEPEIFDFIPEGRPVDFSSEVFPALLAQQKALYGFVCEGYWEDVGTLDAYVSAHKDVLDRKVDVDVPGFRLDAGVWLGEGAEIDPSARVEGPAIVGDNTRVEAGARLGPYTVLGSNVMVQADADLERVIAHDGAYIGRGVRMRGTIVGRGSDLRANVRTEEGVVLGDECFVGARASIGAAVKIYPYKTVEAGAIVNRSLVWESRGSRSLFGPDGVAGLANVDITPELATRVAMAFGATLKKGATVTTSRDSSRSARMLKRSVMAGLNAAGINVDDLEVAPVPVTRFQVRSQRSQAGISVRLVAGDPQSVVLRFFDDLGVDISETAARKIERNYFREDFRRVFPGDIGDIDFPPRTLEYYTAALMSEIDASAIRTYGFKAVLDYAYGSTAFVMPNVLAKLGADILAVNPYASTSGASAHDPVASAAAVAELVRTSGAHLGAVIDAGGEHITLIDDEGHVLSDTETLLAFVELVTATSEPGCRIALPVVATARAAEIAAAHGAEVVWTKVATSALMAAALEDDVRLAVSIDGGVIVPSFLPAFDAMATFAKLLELLARNGVRLSKIVAALPRTFVVHETVPTPWEQKGAVMRTLMEQADGELILIDGVKELYDDGWALVLPDPEEPVTHVWAEAGSDGDARRRAQEHVGRIRRLLG